MKRSIAVNLFTVLFVCTFFVPDAAAVGVGVDFNAGYGDTDWVEDDWSSTPRRFSSDDSMMGIGYFFDTAPAGDSLFNYRFSFGWEKNEFDLDDGDAMETKGWYMTHDFGFGLVRTKNLRIWTGPEIKRVQYKGELRSNKAINIDLDGVGSQSAERQPSKKPAAAAIGLWSQKYPINSTLPI